MAATIDSSSYSSVKSVAIMTRHLQDGEPIYDENSNPPITEVVSIIDEVSSILNDAIAACGFSIPISAAGPKRSCDSWVRVRASAMVELTQRSAGFDGSEDSRYASLWNLYKDALEWVQDRKEGWQNQGVTVSVASSDALSYTALKKHSERADPNNENREQPRFRRRQFIP